MEAVQTLKKEVGRFIIGQEQVIERLIMALLANGNVLMEGLPGLAKTRAIKSLSKVVESEFRRIQFKPDLLPSDVTGTEVYYEQAGKGMFKFQPGLIFGNLILADEINRAPAKVQAALLEAMEERQVTVAGTTHKLPDLFMVLATQNPIEQEGTYPLPEAHMDRFLLYVMIGYPDDDSEALIMRLVRDEEKSVEQADEKPKAHQPEASESFGSGSSSKISQKTVFDARREIRRMPVAKIVENYIVDIVGATRRPEKYSEDLGDGFTSAQAPEGP